MPRQNPSIGFYLVALVMLAVVPLMLIAGLLIWRQSLLQRQVFDRSLLQTAQALSVAVDRQLSADRVMLETLAQSPLIDSGNIDPRSLRIELTIVSWVKDGVEHFARLR